MTKCGSDKTEFKCEKCPAVFTTAGNLKAHITNKSCEIQCNLLLHLMLEKYIM